MTSADPTPDTARPRLCGECGQRATYLVEPAGRYDAAGWAAMPSCPVHLATVVTDYIGDDVPRVQVRYVDAPERGPVEECCNEGCDGLVDDGYGLCLRCEHDIFEAVGA